jgi:hypothetical protein
MINQARAREIAQTAYDELLVVALRDFQHTPENVNEALVAAGLRPLKGHTSQMKVARAMLDLYP